ncbi:MAG: DUF1207 domain-containing protein [Candidatus Kapaibacteriales bacterium]
MLRISVALIVFITAFQMYCGTQFRPFSANPMEARVGVIQINEENEPTDEFQNPGRLRLDIGITYDLFDLYDNEKVDIDFGTDWMVWTRLRSEGRFKFPVETSDYWFGINSTIRPKNLESDSWIKDWGGRIRVAHISSHLVDGYTNRQEEEWSFIKTPLVYSREFVELSGYISPLENLRLYAGLNYIFSTIPDDFSLLIPQLGVDYRLPVSNLLSGLNIEAGYDGKIVGIGGDYSIQNSMQAGLLYLGEKGKGLFFGLYYYSGPSIHGMFFMDRDGYIGLGGQVYFY